MKQRNRRLVAILCVLCMLFSSMPVSAYTDPSPATPTDLGPASGYETPEEGETEQLPEAEDQEDTDLPEEIWETWGEDEPEPESEPADENPEYLDDLSDMGDLDDPENPDEPQVTGPEANLELSGSDDVRAEGSLEGNPPADYLIRFTPEKDQTLWVILKANGELEATVTAENEDTVKQMVSDPAAEDGQTVLVLPYYKVRTDETYLIRISGNAPAAFSLRMVKTSILKAEEESEAEPETPSDEDSVELDETPVEPETPAYEESAEPDEAPENIPEDTPEEAPEEVHEQEPEQSPEVASEQTPEEDRAEIPEDIPEDIPAEKTEDTPETTQEETTEEIPAETSEGTPADEADPSDVDPEEEPADEPFVVPASPETEEEEFTPATQTDLEPVQEEPVEIRIDAAGSPVEAYIVFLSDAGIPQDAELQVRELTEAERAAYQADTAQALNAEDETYLRYTKYLEFTLVSNGEAIELNAPVKAYVTLPDVSEGADALQVVRFDNRTPVLLGSERTEKTISFETDTLDVFGIGNALVTVTDHETELAKVEVLSFSEDAPVSMTVTEDPEVIEGLEVLGTFTIEDNTAAVPGTEEQEGLFIKAELKNDAELNPMEGVALYSVDEDGNTDILMEELTGEAKIAELEATQVAVIKDTGYRHLTLTVNPDETTDDQIVTLDGMMPKGAEAAVTDVTEQYAEYTFPADEAEGETAAPEATDPAGETEAAAEETTAETTEDTTEEETTGTRTTLAAYEISISHEDGEYQPDADKPIGVEILDSRITADKNIELWHIRDDGTKEQITGFTAEEGRIVFDAFGFSVYIVIDHEDETVVAPRVEFHFIADNPTTVLLSDDTIDYYIGNPYNFLNTHNEPQNSQILADGETLQLITDPGNRSEQFFYGWYIVNPHPIEGQTDSYGIGTANSKLYYTWTSAPVSITFESPVSIRESKVSIGDEIHWSISGVSGSGTVDSDGNAHVLLAPVFDKYNFANFMLYARDTGETASKTLMTRKMIALGSSSIAEVKISDIQSASVDPVHLIFTGWEYQETDGNESEWIYKQTVDYTGAEMHDPGKDGVYLSADLDDTTSIDLYPKFVQARWIDFFSGVSGCGATYVASRFRESWGIDPQHPTEGMEGNINGEKNVFTSLPVPRRDGYQFGGWYAFAVTDPQTGEIRNLEDPEPFTVHYLDHDYHAHTHTDSMTAVRITDNEGAIVYSGEETLTVDGQDYYLFTGNTIGENGKALKLFDGIDRLTLYANWIPVDTDITIVYWTENAEDSQYTASATQTISTAQLTEVLGESYKSGSILTLDVLAAYDAVIENAEGLQSEHFLVNPMTLEDVGAVPEKSDPNALEAREEIFYDRNDALTRANNTYQVVDDNGDSTDHEGQVIDGQGTTSFNVYYSRKIFKLVFHIGRDSYCKAGGQQREDGDNWLEYMYTDSMVTQVLGRTSRGTAAASYPGVAHMTYNGHTYDSTYATNSDNIKFDYVPKPGNENDQNLYIITAKYGERIADRWPSPVNSAFQFDQIQSGSWKTPYIWTAAYTSLFHVMSFNRDTPGNPQGANADVNGIFEYMSAELCANRTGDGLINANQVHHLVAWFGEANNQNRFKKYHYLYEKVDGITLPADAVTHEGTEYLTNLQTTWSAANTNGQGIGVILNDTYYEDPAESPVPVVSNLEPQFQMVTEKEGYQLVYSCYEGQKRSADNSYHVFFFYKPKEYKLTFMFETGPVEEFHLYRQTLATAEKEAPEKEGYQFVGWYTNEAGEGDAFNFAEATMPSEGVVLYPVYKVLQYRVKIEPNGGVIDHINYTHADKYGNKATEFGVEGTGYNTSQATYFTANYGTTVGEYTIKREYIKLTEKEKDPEENVYVPETDRYYYIDTQLDGIYDGDWGLPPNLRNAVYMKEDQLHAYYQFYKAVATDYLQNDYTGVHVFQTFDEFASVYTSYPGTPYRKLKEAEHYSFMGWYQVKNGSVASMPYDFNEPVLEDLELRALWRLDGGYYLKYDPDFIGEDKLGNLVSVTGLITQWTDPKEPSRQLYADQAPTQILHAPENVKEGWVFRGWRVVKCIRQETGLVDGAEKTYNIWSPIQLDSHGDAIYYQPGNNFIVDSNYVSETTPLGSVIYMQAYYEQTEQSVRRPDVANLTLDANGGFITGDESTELSVNTPLDQLGNNGTALLDADQDQIVFGDIQSNISVHLVDYAVSSGYSDLYNTVPHNYFKHPGAYFLLGFDSARDDDYIAEFPADSVIAVQRTDKKTLYAVWEKMVYVNFINTTDEDIHIVLTGTGQSTVSIVNVATGLFDREKTTSEITVPARSNGVDGRVKIVLPGADPGTDYFTATAVNDHLRKKMSVSGEFPAGTDYANNTPSTEIRYGGSVVYNQILQEDMSGEGIFVIYTEEPVEEVVYDVNGGTWTNPLSSAPESGYVHQMGDIYALSREAIEADPSNSYEPTKPTREGMLFVGWTDNADIAARTNFHSEDPVTLGSTTITPDEGSTVLQKVIDEYLWDFDNDPPYDRTLYAVWSETATVTFNLTRSGNNNHIWNGPATTSTPVDHAFYRASGSSNTVTFTLMKGEKVPRPQNPTYGSNIKRTFMEWVTVANYIDTVNQWTTVSRFAFDFDQPVNNDIIIYTSWRDNKNYQIYTFTVNNIVEDALDENEEFTYTVSAEDVNLKTVSSYSEPAVAFTPVTAKLKNGEQYTIKITTLRETSNDKHNYTGYDVYAEVIDREGRTVGSGHLLNYLDADNNLINEGREYTYTIRVAQEPVAGYSTNVYADEAREPILTLLHDQFTFRGSNGDHYKPHTNPFKENGNTSSTVTFVNRRETFLTLTKDILTDLGDWERDFTFTLESVGAEGEEREGTEYAYTKKRNNVSTGSGRLTTADGGNTFTLKKGESITIDVPRNKAAVISEDNTSYTTSWTTDSGTLTLSTDDSNDAEAVFTLTGDASAVVINARETRTVKVRKFVDGDETSGTFGFTLSMMDGTIPYANYTLNSSESIATDADGVAHFNLAHGDEKEFIIPYGARLVVSEDVLFNYTTEAAMSDENGTEIQDEDEASGSFTLSGVAENGTILFTNTPSAVRAVLFDVNGGTWTETPRFVSISGDLAEITEENITETNRSYKPLDPTQSGKIFIGWTEYEDIARATTDFSQTGPVTIGGVNIAPPENGIVLDTIRNEYLWDFSRPVEDAYGKILYAVWSDAVTVTFDVVRTGSNLHVWQGPATTSAVGPYVYYRSSDSSGTITYTLAKGERVPKPEAPTADPAKADWKFIKWVRNTTSYRNTTKKPSENGIENSAYVFSQHVTENTTLSTSWTTELDPQTFVFTITNQVRQGDLNDEFTYTIAVTDELVYGKRGTSTSNSVGLPDRRWGSVTTTLKNNEQYQVLVTVSYISDWGGAYGINIDVTDNDGYVIKSGQVIYCNNNTYKNFVSDGKYTLSVTQEAKTGYVTTVKPDPDSINNVDDPGTNSEKRQFVFNSSFGTRSEFTPQINEFSSGEENGLTVIFTNTGELENEPIPAPTGVDSHKAPFVLLMVFGILCLALGGIGLSRAKKRPADTGTSKARVQSHEPWVEIPPRTRGASPSAPPCPRADLWVRSNGSPGKRGGAG